MADIKQKRSFEKKFREAVPNSEGKIWFKHPSRSYSERKVCFMLNSKEVEFPMYMDTESIDKWKQHFNEFVQTGKFDMNYYCQCYGKTLPDEATEIKAFPFVTSYGNKFYTHNPDGSKWLSDMRAKYGDCGMKTVAKPPVKIRKLVCSVCGSSNVQVKAWVNANTNEFFGYSNTDDENSWCEDCKKHQHLDYK